MPGVTKSMPASSSSTSTVSDALANLTRAATVALHAVQGAQEHTHDEIARLREERDDALKALHDAQLHAKDLQVREEGWKAALDKSDLTNQHHAETIAQLRAEAQQWKTQLARLEESSRQELDGWKDQYRRAEHERARLSARIEELIAGQLAWNVAAHAYTAPYTPRMPYAALDEPHASSSHAHRAGTPHVNSRSADEGDLAPSTSRKSRVPHSVKSEREPRSQHNSPARPPPRRKVNTFPADTALPSGSRSTPRTSGAAVASTSRPHSQPRQQFIRRVTAIVPVKEEDDTDPGLDELESSGSGSEYDPADQSPEAKRGQGRRLSSASGGRKRAAQEYGEESDVSEYESENGGDFDEGEEDDELLLGAKTKKSPRTQSGGTRQRAGPRQSGSAKKRKVDADGRTGPAKAAKTR